MSRILTTFLLASGALICLNSCNLDMYGTYTFSHAVTYGLQDNSDEDAKENMEAIITEYLSRYIELDKTLTYTGSYSEAIQYGSDYLSGIFSNFYLDGDYLNSQLQTDEYIQYYMYMTGEGNNITLGSYIWRPQEEEE